MSEYVEVKTAFQDPTALVAALMETGHWKAEQIEVHPEVQNLYGYHGDVRSQRAHIIIRRAYVGPASNDIGFERQADGRFVGHISEYDRTSRGYNEEWNRRLRQNYAFHATRIPQEARGRRVTREWLPNGHQRVVIEGYR